VSDCGARYRKRRCMGGRTTIVEPMPRTKLLRNFPFITSPNSDRPMRPDDCGKSVKCSVQTAKLAPRTWNSRKKCTETRTSRFNVTLLPSRAESDLAMDRPIVGSREATAAHYLRLRGLEATLTAPRCPAPPPAVRRHTDADGIGCGLTSVAFDRGISFLACFTRGQQLASITDAFP
jgi:hypothetical protein